MAIVSRTDIANLALGEIGARRITSIDSGTSTEANACRLHLDHVANTLLRRHQWSFATARLTLSRLSAPPLSEWAAMFQLPQDFIRLIRIASADGGNPVTGFSLEGRRLLTAGGDVAQIVYVSNAIPIPEWDPLFVDAVKYKLAAAINGDITQNPALAAEAMQKLEGLALPAAQTADAREVLSGENYGVRQAAGMSALVASRFARGGTVVGTNWGGRVALPPQPAIDPAPDLDSVFNGGF